MYFMREQYWPTSIVYNLERNSERVHLHTITQIPFTQYVRTPNVAASLTHDPTEVIWLTICVKLYLKCSKLIHHRDRNEITKCNRWYVVDASHCTNGSILWSYLPGYERKNWIKRRGMQTELQSRFNINELIFKSNIFRN